ncbi:hypothetical protein DICVIV_01462 [Dictyocaulus viviparus]|uniref:Acyltransferase C-terminal domain-containing protein n=1 Tax=Dictyocaulus viviparus TaxID=29172 RepID=A0A0D8Y6M0_DICVI|nr:hypothetical protein DICVIV_01462 [Dictyocaulus viviparus]
MASNAYIFLDRTFKTDQGRLNVILEYYSRCGYNYQILLYPEGTDKCPLATERSRKYAEKKHLVHYDYVLHPRTTGFVHMVQNLRKVVNRASSKTVVVWFCAMLERKSFQRQEEVSRNFLYMTRSSKYIDYVYDVTIGFGDCIVQSELDFALYGICPQDVHYQIRKLDINDLPMNDEDLAKWLINLWKEKEEKLRRFYSIERDQREFENTPRGEDFKKTKTMIVGQVMINVFWVTITGFWIYGFFVVPYMFIFAVVSCMIFVFIQRRYGGIEWLTIERFNSSEKLQIY